MKKLFFVILILAVVLVAVYSMGGASFIDALTMKLEDTERYEDCSIKFSMNADMAVSAYITPTGFDWEQLEKRGYEEMKITVTYDVYYEKEWEIGLGYAGSPKYEVSIFNSDGLGKMDENLSTTTSPQTRTFSIKANISDLKDTRLVLSFSTDNIQNMIYFENIKVDYKCYK